MLGSKFKKRDQHNNESVEPQQSNVLEADAESAAAAEAIEDAAGRFSLSNKGQLDSYSLDLVVAVEQIVQARWMDSRQRAELESRLQHANSHNQKLTRELQQANDAMERKNQDISLLEQRISDKNMKLDQVMEDFRELQQTMSAEIAELKHVIELEQHKYSSLSLKHNEDHIESANRISALEETIGKLEAEKQQLQQKFDILRKENEYLLSTVNEFTNRMASTFTHAMDRTADHSAD